MILHFWFEACHSFILFFLQPVMPCCVQQMDWWLEAMVIVFGISPSLLGYMTSSFWHHSICFMNDEQYGTDLCPSFIFVNRFVQCAVRGFSHCFISPVGQCSGVQRILWLEIFMVVQISQTFLQREPRWEYLSIVNRVCESTRSSLSQLWFLCQSVSPSSVFLPVFPCLSVFLSCYLVSIILFILFPLLSWIYLFIIPLTLCLSLSLPSLSLVLIASFSVSLCFFLAVLPPTLSCCFSLFTLHRHTPPHTHHTAIRSHRDTYSVTHTCTQHPRTHKRETEGERESVKVSMNEHHHYNNTFKGCCYNVLGLVPPIWFSCSSHLISSLH